MNKAKVFEPQREIAIIEEADVVVIGGGPGGMPAAVAAARQGSKTVLIERYGMLGGLATTCLLCPIVGYAPFNDTANKLILGGIPVEIIRRLQKIGGALDNDKIIWWCIRFNPELFKIVADNIVEEAKVKLLLHSFAVGVIVKNRCIEAVIIESKSGRQAITGKVFIDATGDGDIAYHSGCSYTKGHSGDGVTQIMGSRFTIGGVGEMTHEEIIKGRRIYNDAISNENIYTTVNFIDQKAALRNIEAIPDTTRISSANCKGDGTDVQDLTYAELKTRKNIFKILKILRNKKIPGFELCSLINTSFQIGVRETRQIMGEYTLTAEDVIKVKKFPETTIARGCWYLDVGCPLCKKNKNQFPQGIYLPKGEYYDIPYGCLVAKDIDNLLLSGRCISGTHQAMGSARVVGTCMAIGESAGTAATLSLQQKVEPGNLDVSELQKQLRKSGVPL